MTLDTSLTEEFDSPTGYLWDNYDAYQASDRATMALLKHKDIRIFDNNDDSYLLTMLNLSTLTMTNLNLYTMNQLQTLGLSTGGGEAWSTGTVAKTVGDNYVSSLELTVTGGGTAFSQSVINGLASGYAKATIDLMTGFENDDHIVISFPNYPSGINLAGSYFDLTDNASGLFYPGPTSAVQMSTSITTPTVGAPSELRFLRSQFTGIDLSKVTGVRFRFGGGSTPGTVIHMVGGIRLLSKNWKYTGIDVDTRKGRLRKTVPRNGDPTGAKEFTRPILWKASEPSGHNDPRPIDTEMGLVFNTGTIVGSNSFSMYFREVTEDFMTQLDLNGLKMSDLAGSDQPDIGTAKYNSRTQVDLERFTQTGLEIEEQFDLERTADSLSASWIQVTMQWASGSSLISFFDTEGNGYSFNSGSLTANTQYFFKVRLEENSLRGVLYSLDAFGGVVSKVFDTTEVRDTFAFKRRQGRFGWYAELNDGAAWVDSLRERYTSYAEYRSLPLYSVTPVEGAELFVGSSPNIELFSALGAGPYNSSKTLVERDSDRSTSGSSWRITAGDSTPLQGVQSNTFLISDFANSRLTFDVFYPSTASPLQVFLSNPEDTRRVELVVPEITRDQWQSVIIDFPYDSVQTGLYKLVFAQIGSGIDPWWIDSVSMFTRAVAWDGRAVVDDPWKSNNAQWTPFHEIYNKQGGGVMFPRRGNELQIRGKALTQSAQIDRVQFKPKYAELGRIPSPVTTGGKPLQGTMTTSFSTSSPGPALTLRFLASSTAGSPNGFIASYQWNFGDGAIGYGLTCDHTYDVSGTYTVRLVVTDNYGYQNTYTNTVAV